MKRQLALLLTLALVLSLLLAACGGNTPTTPTDTNATTGTDAAEGENKVTGPSQTEPQEPADNPYKYLHSFVNGTDFDIIAKAFEDYQPSGNYTLNSYWTAGGPYVLRSLYDFKDSTLKSISLPIMETGAVNSDGELVFTLSIVENDYENFESAYVTPYEIKIKPEDYGITASTKNIQKVIKIDLTPYNIYVGEKETVAFSSEGDTLIPVWINGDTGEKHPIYKLLMQNAPQLIQFTMNAGTKAASFSKNALILNLEYERTYIGREAYDKAVCDDLDVMLEELKKEYGGKYISTLGDSITTYAGYSNNTAYNSTIGGNLLYYGLPAQAGALIPGHDYTWWGSFLRDDTVGMKLCVNNAFGTASVMLTQDSSGTTGFSFKRAQNLHNNDGVDPDLILTYMGINDTWIYGDKYVSPVGELYDLLMARGDKSAADVVAEWFPVVWEKAERENFHQAGRNSRSYDNFGQAYAIMMKLMKDRYPNAKIVCVTLSETKSTNNDASLVAKYNECIKAISEYFGFIIADQQTVINQNTLEAYMFDGAKIHPNSYGHKRLFEVVVRALYRDLKNNK